MPLFQFVTRRIENYKRKTADGVQNVKENVRDLLFRGGMVALIASIIIWVSIFLYVAFYYTYMPSVTHVRPVHVQFKACDDTKGICTFPSAHVQLTRRQQLLMIGQPYKMYLNLEMPESPANKKLGMFMVCVQLHDKENLLVANSCRAAMLHYRSSLLHMLRTLVFSPLMMFGSTEEKQNIVLELFNDYEEDQNHPVTDVFVEIQSRHLELYSATLYIQAHFTGLRYLMFHWPVLSATVGIMSNLFVILLICTLSWCHLFQEDIDYEGVIKNVGSEHEDTSEEKHFKFKGEVDDSSFEDASFMEDTSRSNEGDNGSQEFLTDLRRSDSFQLVHSSRAE